MDKLTIIRSINPDRVCKTYTLNGDSLDKSVIANVNEGEAITVDVPDAAKMMKVLRSVTKRRDLVICPGIWHGAQTGQKFSVMSERALCDLTGAELGKVQGGVIEHNGNLVSARLKRGIDNSSWVLLDADNPPGMPAEWACMTIGERLELWEPFLPGITKAERFELRGSSARVTKDGDEPGQATHAWLRITNPELLHMLKAHIRVQMSLHGASFTFNKYSRETGAVVGQEPRSVFDLAVFDTGRLVFCAQPDVDGAPGYAVHDAGVVVVNEGGGAFDNSWIKSEPTKSDIDKMNAKDGTELRYKAENGSLSAYDGGMLTLDTPIEVKGVTRPLSEWATELGPNAKMRCEAPFRMSQSEAAFIKTFNDGTPMVHDIGCNTTYTVKKERKEYDWKNPFTAVDVPPSDDDSVDIYIDGTGEVSWPTPIADVDPFTLPRRKWVYGNTYIRNFVTVTASAGGIGKTSLTAVEALAIATGRNLLEQEVKEQTNVWLLNLEDPLEEMQLRVAAAMQHYGIKYADVSGKLFMDAEDTIEMTFATETRDGLLQNDELLAYMTEKIKANNIGAVIIDPFVSTHMVNENSNAAIQAVVAMFRKLARDTGAAIHLVHHVRKGNGDDSTIDSVRGAGSLIGAARAARVLNRVSEAKAIELGVPQIHAMGILRIDDGKANLAPPAEAALYARMVGVKLPNDEWVGVATHFKLPDEWEGMDTKNTNAILSLIGGGFGNGELYSIRPQDKERWAGHVIMNYKMPAGVEDKTEGQAKMILKKWLETGLIEVGEYWSESQRKDRKGITFAGHVGDV